MTISDLTELTASLLVRYYENNIQPFLDYCHDDILWIGPANGQIIRTKQALADTFSQESNPLRFAVYDLIATPCYISSNSAEVLLNFIVDTFWPDGKTNRVYQRITFAWENKKEYPRIHVCHISNSIDYDARDTIYPIHYLEHHPQMTLYSGISGKLYFKGVNHAILCTSPDQILYIESIGNHTLIHLTSEIFECTERLSSIAGRINDSLLRCHASYLVNPLYVQSVERFSLTLLSGKKLPIPEKKYTAVKAALLRR